MTPILYAPSQILDRAATDPGSPEAKSMKVLMRDLANWHSGDQSYLILPSDLSDGSTTQKAFDVKLLGIDGAGKQFDTTKIIQERQKAILNSFGAGFILLGQDGVGSYALSDTQKGMHGFFVEKDINFLCEVFNRELIPQLLALNEIRLDDEDMPRLAPGVVDERDVDLISKAVQRVTAVGQLALHPELMNEILEDLGFDYRIPEDIVNDESKWEEWSSRYLPKPVSRSGDGMESGNPSGTGDAVSDEDDDAANVES